MPGGEAAEESIGKCLFFLSFQGQMKEAMPSLEISVTIWFIYLLNTSWRNMIGL